MRCTILLAAAQAPPAPSAPPVTVDFNRDIEPIFQNECYACHGPDQQMSGFRLDVPAEALKGGYSGPVILPGDSSSAG